MDIKMHVYFKKYNNYVLQVSPVQLGYSNDQLFTPEGSLPVFLDEYDVVELSVDIPYNFQQDKYKLEDNQVVYIDSYVELQDKWNKIRVKRDELLKVSDTESGIIWTDLWVSKDQTTRDAWTAYRQALRNIPQGSSPDSVTWPNKPVPVEDDNPSEVVEQLP